MIPQPSAMQQNDGTQSSAFKGYKYYTQQQGQSPSFVDEINREVPQQMIQAAPYMGEYGVQPYYGMPSPD
jgi:hypothetical protein